jgi:hypothetical protein
VATPSESHSHGGSRLAFTIAGNYDKKALLFFGFKFFYFYIHIAAFLYELSLETELSQYAVPLEKFVKHLFH